MSIASDYKGYDEENLLFDHETWQIYFEKALRDDPETAESLSRVLFTLLEAIRSGPDGIAQASNSLMDGIEWAYLSTSVQIVVQALPAIPRRQAPGRG